MISVAMGLCQQRGFFDHKDIVVSIRRAFSTTGRAVVVTGMTVVIGIIFWYFSAIRFQAEVGFLLAFS
ncbi:MAG: hypothetical protein COX51_01490 [Syntrophobacteraceae bacterium CG23_combo_of_CG06-09_8_20_14_all_50_8]|nr:MAG: hypothetical protein COX51_01490 [Syntrophobacteraceae bacterium CG23_combo_of_CG06-09_8_20_14_all_50_8]